MCKCEIKEYNQDQIHMYTHTHTRTRGPETDELTMDYLLFPIRMEDTTSSGGFDVCVLINLGIACITINVNVI